MTNLNWSTRAYAKYFVLRRASVLYGDLDGKKVPTIFTAFFYNVFVHAFADLCCHFWFHEGGVTLPAQLLICSDAKTIDRGIAHSIQRWERDVGMVVFSNCLFEVIQEFN